MKKIIFLLLISTSHIFAAKPKITFLEFGATTCIPCKQMKDVMKAVETDYGSRVKVTFHDINLSQSKEAMRKYKVQLIPTQIFLDSLGKQIFRHEGFYPKKEIDSLFAKNGLKPIKK